MSADDSSTHRKGKLRSLEATNRALADAMELRAVFYDVTRFVEQVTNITSVASAAVASVASVASAGP